MRHEGEDVQTMLDECPSILGALGKLLDRPRSLGLSIRFSSPQVYADTWGSAAIPDGAAPLGTPFDPHVTKLTKDNSVFIIVRDAIGMPVAMQAIKLHHFGNSNLAAQANRLTLFFDDPATQAHEADYAICSCLSAPLIHGDCARPGATWVRKDYRGDRGGWRLSQVLGRLVRALAFMLWDPQFFFSFVGEELARRGSMRAAYGYSKQESGMRMRLRSIDQDAVLLWMDRDELMADLGLVLDGKLPTPETSVA